MGAVRSVSRSAVLVLCVLSLAFSLVLVTSNPAHATTAHTISVCNGGPNPDSFRYSASTWGWGAGTKRLRVWLDWPSGTDRDILVREEFFTGPSMSISNASVQVSLTGRYYLYTSVKNLRTGWFEEGFTSGGSGWCDF
jgi:hypothetical protein